MEYKDYYAILGVPKDASPGDIQKAYRKLARKYHPDVNQSPEAEARFKEINEAHAVLKDPEKRAKYDRFGSAWKQAQTTGSPPPDFEDIFTVFTSGGSPGGGFEFGGEGFSSFFDLLFRSQPTGGRPGGPGAGFGWQSPGGASRAGADQQGRLTLGLEEAARGGQREITLSDPETGRTRTLRVTIPPGIRQGQRIRLAGQGGAGARGGRKGNLLLTVEILPHPRFRLEGDDLHVKLPVAPWEAALGGKAAVPTLEGEVTVKIPPGSSSGRKIRLRGKGFPASGTQRGDLLAEIRIVVPETLSEPERELFEKLARKSKFEAR